MLENLKTEKRNLDSMNLDELLIFEIECPPTFGIEPNVVIGILAGGNDSMFAKEEAEDSYELGQKNMKELKILKEDIVIGLAASGRTPFVIGAFGLCK